VWLTNPSVSKACAVKLQFDVPLHSCTLQAAWNGKQ